MQDFFKSRVGAWKRTRIGLIRKQVLTAGPRATCTWARHLKAGFSIFHRVNQERIIGNAIFILIEVLSHNACCIEQLIVADTRFSGDIDTKNIDAFCKCTAAHT
jgi:hypothetical protein